MAAILTMAVLLLATPAPAPALPQPALACSVTLLRADRGWMKGWAQVDGEGEIRQGVFVDMPAVLSAAPDSRELPQLSYEIDQPSRGGPGAISLHAIQIMTEVAGGEVGPGWTAELLADGARLAGGPVVWDDEDDVFTRHLPPERRIQRGRYRIEAPGAKLVRTLQRAKAVTAVIRAPGRDPWTAGYGPYDPGSLRASRDEAVGLMRKSAANPGAVAANLGVYCLPSREKASSADRPATLAPPPSLPIPPLTPRN